MFKVGEVVYLAKDINCSGLRYVSGTKALIKKIESDVIVLEIIDEEIGDNELEVECNEILKPCPFCGSQSVIHRLYDDNSVFVKVGCIECGSSTNKIESSIYYTAIDRAIEYWNKRV